MLPSGMTKSTFFVEKEKKERIPYNNIFFWTKEKLINTLELWRYAASSSHMSLQKRLLFAMKLFRWLQKAVGKTSFFDGKSFSSTITRQILKYLWRQNEFVEDAYYFCQKYDLFWREVFPPYFLRRHKNVHR